MFDTAGAKIGSQDLGAIAAPTFLPSGDLIAATWNGEIVRVSRANKILWRTRVEPGVADIRPTLLAPDMRR